MSDVPVSDAARIDKARRRGFYPLVLILEQLAGGPPVGCSRLPSEERIHFRHDPALAFSTSDVSSVREITPEPNGWDAPGERIFEVTTTFLGLTGGATPLPHYIAEEVAQEDPESCRVRDFLDLFHHRLLSLLYRALAGHDLPNAWRADGADRWTPRLLALFGIDAAGEALPPLPPWRLLRLAPLLVERTMTAQGLAAAVADALSFVIGKVPVEVEPFVGSWAEIAPDQLTRLGQQACRLGQDCLLGQRVFDAAGRFRVRVGPLSAEQYQRAVDEHVHEQLEELVDALVTEPLEHEIVLWLEQDAAPALKLGSSRLGRDSWLGGQRREAHIESRRAV